MMKTLSLLLGVALICLGHVAHGSPAVQRNDAVEELLAKVLERLVTNEVRSPHPESNSMVEDRRELQTYGLDAAKIALLTGVFTSVDTDGDGSITFPELHDFYQNEAEGIISIPRLDRRIGYIIATTDKNDNFKVELQELVQEMAKTDASYRSVWLDVIMVNVINNEKNTSRRRHVD